MLDRDHAGPELGAEQPSVNLPADPSTLTSAFSVELEFTSESDSRVPRVCYALAHNRIPFEGHSVPLEVHHYCPYVVDRSNERTASRKNVAPAQVLRPPGLGTTQTKTKPTLLNM